MPLPGPFATSKEPHRVNNAPRVIATGFALSAFATAIYAGLLTGNDARTTLVHALIGMIGCYVLSMPLTAVLMRVATEHVREYEARNPLPREEDTALAPIGLEAGLPSSSGGDEGGVEKKS